MLTNSPLHHKSKLKKSLQSPPLHHHHPLTKQKKKVKEALDRKYKELEKSKPILEVLENYMTYRKKLDEVLMEER
ncbi:hypothetical protein Tco_0473672, partial [Tanacetum coccineum]